MLKSHIGETIVDFKGLDDVGFYVLFKESDQKVTMFNTEKKHLLYVNSYMERSLAKRASIPGSN
jgi:hypothetical protein